MFVWQLVRTRSDFVIVRGTTLRRVKVSPAYVQNVTCEPFEDCNLEIISSKGSPSNFVVLHMCAHQK